MSGLVTRFAYDPTGVNPDNLITNEPHVLSNKQVRAFAPIYGPFYTDTAKVYDAATNTLLERGTQYQFVELLKEISLKVGKEICCVVLILDKNVSGNINFAYNCVGGLYQNQSAEGIVSLYETVAADTRPVAWKDILNKPLQFEPTDHLHLLSDITGFEPVVTVLERIRNAIMLSDVPIYEAMVDYFNKLVADLQTAVAEDKLSVAALMNEVNALEQALLAEIARATGAETSLNTALNAEVLRAKGVENTLTNNLAAEINRASNAESVLTTNLTAEISRATNKENTINTALSNEISRATTTETNINNALTTEVNRAKAAENTLTTNLTTEVNRATNAESTLTTSLNQEITRATNMENTINNSLTVEVNRAKAAENTLTSNLASEVTRSTNADTTLTNSLNAEITRATNAENSKINWSAVNVPNGVAGLNGNNRLYNEAETQAYGTIDHQLATTGFVDRLRDVPQQWKNTDYQIALSDRGQSIDTTANVYINTVANVPFPVGATISINNLGATNITLVADAGVTLRLAGTTKTGNRTISGYGLATIRYLGSDTWTSTGAGLS